MGKIARYLLPKTPRKLPKQNLLVNLFLILRLVVIAGLFIVFASVLSPALSRSNLDIEIQRSPDSTLEINKNIANKNLANRNISQNLIQNQLLPAPRSHSLPSTLRQWQDSSNSGDYFTQIKPTPAGYLVWSQFPVKIYITTSNKLPKQQGQTWVETVSQAVNEWQNYLPLEIVTQPEIADIIIERKAPPLQFDRKRKISRARSAQTTYEFYTKSNTLSHRFIILLSPSQTGKYLLAATRHELGHALGIWGHSPVKSDALYFSQVRNPPPISPRDVNTLKRVYEQPTSLGWSVS